MLSQIQSVHLRVQSTIVCISSVVSPYHIAPSGENDADLMGPSILYHSQSRSRRKDSKGLFRPRASSMFSQQTSNINV